MNLKQFPDVGFVWASGKAYIIENSLTWTPGLSLHKIALVFKAGPWTSKNGLISIFPKHFLKRRFGNFCFQRMSSLWSLLLKFIPQYSRSTTSRHSWYANRVKLNCYLLWTCTLSFYVTKDSVIINDCLLLSEDPTILYWCKIKIVFCLPKQNCIMLLNILFSRCLIASSHQAIEHITWIKKSVEKLHQPAELSP